MADASVTDAGDHPSFSAGDVVLITKGTYENFPAYLDEVYPERGAARVVLMVFIKQPPFEIPLEWLRSHPDQSNL